MTYTKTAKTACILAQWNGHVVKLCHFNCSARAVRARLNKHVDDLSAQKSGSRIGMVCKYIIHRFLATFAMMPVLERYHADIQHVHVHFIILGQHENENINKYCILYRKRRLHLFMQIGRCVLWHFQYIQKWKEMAASKHLKTWSPIYIIPLWKILVSWDDYSQYMGKNVPNHQLVIVEIVFSFALSCFGVPSFLLRTWSIRIFVGDIAVSDSYKQFPINVLCTQSSP